MSSSLPAIRQAYNGYWFVATNLGQPKVYNADMVMYCLRFILNQKCLPGEDETVDTNSLVSDNIFNFAASLPHAGGFLRLLQLSIPVGTDIKVTGMLAWEIHVNLIMDVYSQNLLAKLPPHVKNIFVLLCYYYGTLTYTAREQHAV